MNKGIAQVERADKAQQEDKHTPGPWKAITWHGQHGVHDAMDNDVCETYGEDQEANARLIAAAPDMLKALEGLLEATRKAYDTACNSNDDFADDDAHFVGEWIDEAKAVIASAKAK